MKKIFSFLTLFVLFFIGFIHNSMMAFSMSNIGNINIIEKKICCIPDSKTNNNHCIDSCCIEGTIEHGISSSDNIFDKKILKTVNTRFDINSLDLYSFKNKNLINKTGPPYYYRAISNYSYHTLIKIIKSNT